MLNKNYLYNQKRKYEKIKAKIASSKENEIEGSLIIQDNKYFHSVYKNKKQVKTYIPKENTILPRQLTQKKYYRKLKPTVDTNLKILNYILKYYKGATISDAFYSLGEDERKLADPVEPTWEQTVDAFYKLANQTNNYKIENPVYTKNNEEVRSKSERLIADILYDNNIPYIYENTIKLPSGILVSPDFTILTKTGRIIYLEHLGMLDSPEYLPGAINKMYNYQEAGFAQGINIIYTIETSKRPLNQNVIYKIVEKYFL